MIRIFGTLKFNRLTFETTKEFQSLRKLFRDDVTQRRRDQVKITFCQFRTEPVSLMNSLSTYRNFPIWLRWDSSPMGTTKLPSRTSSNLAGVTSDVKHESGKSKINVVHPKEEKVLGSNNNCGSNSGKKNYPARVLKFFVKCLVAIAFVGWLDRLEVWGPIENTTALYQRMRHKIRTAVQNGHDYVPTDEENLLFGAEVLQLSCKIFAIINRYLANITEIMKSLFEKLRESESFAKMHEKFASKTRPEEDHMSKEGVKEPKLDFGEVFGFSGRD